MLGKARYVHLMLYFAICGTLDGALSAKSPEQNCSISDRHTTLSTYCDGKCNQQEVCEKLVDIACTKCSGIVKGYESYISPCIVKCIPKQPPVDARNNRTANTWGIYFVNKSAVDLYDFSFDVEKKTNVISFGAVILPQAITSM